MKPLVTGYNTPKAVPKKTIHTDTNQSRLMKDVPGDEHKAGQIAVKEANIEGDVSFEVCLKVIGLQNFVDYVCFCQSVRVMAFKLSLFQNIILQFYQHINDFSSGDTLKIPSFLIEITMSILSLSMWSIDEWG